MRTLPHFIQRLEESILENEVREIAEIEKKQCSVTLPDFQLSRGEVEVSINQYFIGTLDPNSSNKLTFNCNYLKNESNMVYLTTIGKRRAALSVSGTQHVIFNKVMNGGTIVSETVTEASSTVIDGIFFNLKFLLP